MPLKMQPVESSTVEAIGHDPETNTLHVQFKGTDETYRYSNVSTEKHRELMASPSKGRHLAKHIKGVHAFTKLPRSRHS